MNQIFSDNSAINNSQSAIDQTIIPLPSLYLHIPFCEHKCIYCDFYSIESLGPMNNFLRALRSEIEMYKSYGKGETFESIFFGGGTPSLLEPAVVKELLDLLHSTYTITSDAEITLETNPGTVDQKKLEGFYRAGINRLSFGVQSFHDDELKFLTRIHSSSQAKEAVRFAKNAGFENINIDLIFALPHQTFDRWNSTLDQTLELDPQHISAYSLIVEHNTPLSRMVQAKQVAPLPIEEEAGMYGWTMEYLHKAGYEHYEVSNYAKPGLNSRHNGNYWHHVHYLGFGPSAHSFWSDRRWWNIANINSYIEKISSGRSAVSGEELLSDRQLLDECVMLGLRSSGVDLHELRTKFGMGVRHEIITPLVENNLASIHNHLLKLTDKGFLLCDEITERLLTSLLAA